MPADTQRDFLGKSVLDKPSTTPAVEIRDNTFTQAPTAADPNKMSSERALIEAYRVLTDYQQKEMNILRKERDELRVVCDALRAAHQNCVNVAQSDAGAMRVGSLNDLADVPYQVPKATAAREPEGPCLICGSRARSYNDVHEQWRCSDCGETL